VGFLGLLDFDQGEIFAMKRRNVGRKLGQWVCVIAVAFLGGTTVAACGSSAGSSSNFEPDASRGADGESDATSGSSDATQDAPSFLGKDASSGCKPKTCAELGFNCGQAVQCGAPINCNANGAGGGPQCPAGEICGAAMPNVCGAGTSSGDGGQTGDGGPTCTVKTCAQLGFNCGEAVSCGMIINCNANGSSDAGPDCPSGEICGGNGMVNVCVGGVPADGGSNCKPKTCTDLGYNCGLASDGCNGIINCNANGSDAGPDCPTGLTCGYGGVANVCGPSSQSSGCDAGSSTSLTGFVYDPANHLPVYNALVYVPAGAVQTPTTGVNGTCGCTAQAAYTSAFTKIDGSFTLHNPPAGSSVTVVVELGKWQRVFSEPINACQTNVLASNLTLPSTQAEGNIPRFAIDTGGVDAMECVLLKMGINKSEFADPNLSAAGVPQATQRVQMYEGSIVSGGAVVTTNPTDETQLLASTTTLDSYDVILFPCQGGQGNYGTTRLTNLLDYANAGGRFFATHFHYDLLYNNGSFASTATWNKPFGGDPGWGNYYGDPKYTSGINQGFPTGVTLAQWLNQSTVYGGTFAQIPVGVIRNNITAVNAAAQLWLSTEDNTAQNGPGAGVPIHYTFDTPFSTDGGAPGTCGRVVYSDFHVESQPDMNQFTGATFPMECPGGTLPSSMTPQEELLEFMLFDLTSCVVPPTCTKLTCANYPTGTCGAQSDGCGGLTTDCGTCTPPQTCGGGGVANQCGAPDAGSCMPKTCTQQNIACGPAGDGCGGVIASCGTCPTGQTCNGGQCYAADGGPPICVPKTCAQQSLQCGLAGDGCGDIIMCPACPTGDKCNAAGQCVSSGSQ
jgi:hypothetical protein